VAGVRADQVGQRRSDHATASGASRAVGAAGPKGEAIAQAALRLFLRDGYERTSVDAIAAEAGVSKRTIYNRYTDKENLFRSVLRDTYTSMMATFRDLAEKHLGDVADVQQDLTAFALEVARTMTTAPDRIALVRLIMTEAPFFPALIRAEQGSTTMHGNVTAYLARLAREGRIAVTDPSEAAEHLVALTINQINARTMFGVEPISDAEVERIVSGGVAVFMRAYRPD
jgi:TetR/AcrR family transcriptional regulator, mexJK operon transcriptional repressor